MKHCYHPYGGKSFCEHQAIGDGGNICRSDKYCPLQNISAALNCKDCIHNEVCWTVIEAKTGNPMLSNIAPKICDKFIGKFCVTDGNLIDEKQVLLATLRLKQQEPTIPRKYFARNNIEAKYFDSFADENDEIYLVTNGKAIRYERSKYDL